MHTRSLMTALLCLFSLVAIAQTSSKKKWKYEPFLSAIPHGGYHWQGINSYSFGIRLFTLQKVHETISLIGNAIVFKQNVTYFSPELKARYYTNLDKRFGLVASASYWTSEVKGNREHRLTPECGLSYAQLINITYGYNFPISEYRLPFFSKHRISILFTVF